MLVLKLAASLYRLVSLLPCLSTIWYLLSPKTENLVFISFGNVCPSLIIRFTEPSYDHYGIISNGCSKSKSSLFVIKSTKE